MHKLILALTIHDENITMVKPHELAALYGQDLPLHLKSARVPKLTGAMSFASPLSKQGLTIALPPHMRIPSPDKVQFAAVGTSPQHTMVHEECGSPPQSREQWSAPPSNFWPDSCASPIRILANTRRKRKCRPQCVVRTFLHPVSRCKESRKYTL